MSRGKSPINAPQVKILHALMGGPLTRGEITELSGVTSLSDCLGPDYAEDIWSSEERYGMRSLYGLGLVRPVTEDMGIGRVTVRWHLTDMGMSEAKRLRAQSAIPSEWRIPNDRLDEVMRRFMPTRTYGLESYTREDINAIRSMLGRLDGVDLASIPDDVIIRQAVNRRKVGAFSKGEEIPEWYEDYRATPEWEEIANAFIDVWGGCAVCCSSNVGPNNVWHRRLVIDNETEHDVIILCDRCRKRNKGAMVKIPAERPD